jgi:tRNA G37 N-methylase Trm5
MRHLLVPNKKVQAALTEITKFDWLSKEHRIFSSEDGKNRLIPISVSANINLPKPLCEFEIVFSEGMPNEIIDTDWWNHLENLVGKDTVIEHKESWPSSHEFFGDMLIVRIDDSIEQYTSKIAQAKLLSIHLLD